MKLNLPFTEISTLVKSKSGKEISITYIDETTVNIEYQAQMNMKFLGLSKNISKKFNAKITVNYIKDTDLYLHYSVDMIGGDFLVSILSSSIPAIKSSEIIDMTDNNSAVIHLAKIKQLKTALEYISVTSITFDTNSVVVNFNVKN